MPSIPRLRLYRIIRPSLVLSQSFTDRLWCGQNEKWWIMGRSPDQFGPEGPEVSTAAACRSPAGNYMARPKRGFVPGGTNSSNPSPSSGESTNFRSPARARRLFYAELADGQLSASDRCELGYSAGMAANWLLWVSPVAGPRGGWLLSARLARCAEPIAGTQPGRREAIFIPLSRHSSPPVAAVPSSSRERKPGGRGPTIAWKMGS